MSYDLSELERIIAAMLRIGTVSALDEANARIKLKSGDLQTDWIPWNAGRAGGRRDWSAPRVGEQMMIFAPGGDPSQAVAGFSLYQDAQPAPANTKDAEHITFPDGSTVDYNSATNTLTVTVSGSGNVIVNCKHATINADTDTTFNTPNAHFTGNVTIDQALTVQQNATVNGSTAVKAITSNGHDIGSTHRHINSGGAGLGGTPQ